MTTPPVPNLIHGLPEAPPARLTATTLSPWFIHLDAGQLARMNLVFKTKVNQNGYVLFRWMAHDSQGPPIIFVTTAHEIAIFDARKEALKGVGKAPDDSMWSRTGPGKAHTKGYDHMRSSQYMLIIGTLNDAGIHQLIIESCKGDFVRPDREYVGHPDLIVPPSDYARLDLRLDGFEDIAKLLTAIYPTAKHIFYFYGIGLSGRSASNPRAILQPAHTGLACGKIQSHIEAVLSVVPKPLPQNPAQPTLHPGTQDLRHAYDDLSLGQPTTDFSTEPKCLPFLARPTKMKVMNRAVVMLLPDTNYVTRCSGPLDRFVARVDGNICVASLPEVRNEVGKTGTGGTPRIKRKIKKHVDYLEGRSGRVRVVRPTVPMATVTKISVGQVPSVGVLEGDMLIRSQVLTLLETMVLENPDSENVLVCTTFDKNMWGILATIAPPAGSTCRVIRMKNQDDGFRMEQALYNVTSEWLETVHASWWWVVRLTLSNTWSDCNHTVTHAFYWVKEDSYGYVLKRVPKVYKSIRQILSDNPDVLLWWMIAGLIGVLQMMIV